MVLGIWSREPNNWDIQYVQNLKDQGFNGFVITSIWDRVKKDFPNSNDDVIRKLVIELLVGKCKKLARLGYNQILHLGAAWGLGSFDGNYLYKSIYESMKNSNIDIIWDWGEFYEDYVEKARFEDRESGLSRKLTREEYCLIVAEKQSDLDNKISIGNTSRNKFKLNSNSLTSYINQTKYWKSTDTHLWIFGQLSWHNLIGSLCYKSKAKWARENGISSVYLYQGNPTEWSSIGWENKIASILGFKEKFEAWQRRRFIKAFKNEN